MTKSALIIHPDYNLYQKNNTVFCSSVQVAQEFSKLHKNVLADVRNLNCSDEFRQLNFQLIRQSLGPFLTNEQAHAVRLLQKEDIRLLYRGIDYQERKYALAVKALPEKLS